MSRALILASASLARRRMLESAGVALEVQPADVDEPAIKASRLAEGAPVPEIAETLAEAKACAVSGARPAALVLGADQVLEIDGALWDKPADLDEARAQLIQLRGRSHALMSAAVIAEAGQPVWRHTSVAKLTMRPFTDAFLDGYLEQTGVSVLSSVGAYHLEGLGAQLFARIEGDFFTVLGLPLIEVLGYLRARGVLPE
ncbi:MAG: Maf family protein [Pseudomonadota bacterium]